MAGLTVLYVALSLLVDQGTNSAIDVAVGALAVIFLAEFVSRFLDSPSRYGYFRDHWIDLVTCLPAVGPLRALRLLRLLGLLRLARQIRSLAYETSLNAEERSLAWVVWPTALLLWLGAAEGLWLVERGQNPHVSNYGDAAYMAFMTMTTVGYGDLHPITPEGKVIAGALVFLGLGLLGFVSAQLTSRWLRVESREAAIEQQLAGIRAEMRELRNELGRSAESVDAARR